MNLLKEVLKQDVFPALGCTEPIAVAYAASLAGEVLGQTITDVEITVDPGVYKNGFAVTIPNTGGEHGNLIAGVLGALVQQPELKMEILKGASPDLVEQAKKLISNDHAQIHCDRSQKDLYIHVLLRSGEDTAQAVIQGSHTHVTRLTHNNRDILKVDTTPGKPVDKDFKTILKQKTIGELIELVEQMDDDDYRYIQRGIEMNLRISKEGRQLGKVSHYISDLVNNKYRDEDVFSSCEVMTTAAADARMAGINLPVMSSGGSGNQGIVAILVPHYVGQHYGIPKKTIITSIGVSHMVNSYIKCFTGDLSPLCGCAIAAGVGAAVALVYQRAGADLSKITLAVNNLVSDLGGMLCDGAKAGCALKVGTSTNSAIRSAQMALHNHGITQAEGFVGATAEQTIQNLSRIGDLGMAMADDTMLDIMMNKASRRIEDEREHSSSSSSKPRE